MAGAQSYLGAASSSKASVNARARAVSMVPAAARLSSGQTSSFAGHAPPRGVDAGEVRHRGRRLLGADRQAGREGPGGQRQTHKGRQAQAGRP